LQLEVFIYSSVFNIDQAKGRALAQLQMHQLIATLGNLLNI